MVKKTSSSRKKSRSGFRKRRRDYAAEYARRVERGLSAGKSRSQARGHSRAGERPRPASPQAIKASRPEELAIRKMAKGASLRAAAREHGLSEERLRRYVKENVSADRVGRRWIIADERPRHFPFYSEGMLVHPPLTPDQASEAGRYMHAVRRFLLSGNRRALHVFEGKGVVDIHGRAHAFEVDPNVLYELEAAGELSFPEIYKIVA